MYLIAGSPVFTLQNSDRGDNLIFDDMFLPVHVCHYTGFGVHSHVFNSYITMYITLLSQ